MPRGGKLKVMGKIEEFNAPHPIRGIEIPPGRYFILQISDTGEGITKKDMDRIFDPFFTTKKVGKGSGLGLAIVYGIVKNHKGYIDLRSRHGSGTTCALYFPAAKIKPPESK